MARDRNYYALRTEAVTSVKRAVTEREKYYKNDPIPKDETDELFESALEVVKSSQNRPDFSMQKKGRKSLINTGLFRSHNRAEKGTIIVSMHA